MMSQNKKEIAKLAADFLVKEGDRVNKNWTSMTITDLKDGGADVSTNFDREIEKNFYDFISKHFPDDGFIGEEFPELQKDGEDIWMIDPIDGTKFFAAGIPLWSTTVSRIKKGQSLADIGVVYNPVSEQLYIASEGNGTTLNGVPVFLKEETDITKLQVSIDVSATSVGESDFTDEVHRMIDILERNFYRARMLGSGALSLAWLAQGFFGAFVDPVREEKKLVDIAGGLLIAKEAGAEIRHHQFSDNSSVHYHFVARPEVLDQLEQLLK
ncbi:MAG: Inositol-1-monophosphatase [candidate division WS6 bacterium OLB20]|uniref:Inositol-1-monophosphatase n=1 Tax=candidate division WS6 bacterium OLB20 TaxID=1617426 RepID=A0A136LXS4_9BACT|nr:MAG: Inositol-1-monophosphatase [candidate division WS6 bacterium OLB20]